LETDKIANAIETSAGGILRRRLALRGDVRPVGALLGVVADAAEDETAIDAFIADFQSRAGNTAREAAAMQPTAQSVTVDGHTTRFLKLDAVGERSGAPLILIHGFGGNHLNWMLNHEALAADRDVYAIDLPGHGGSSKDVGDGSAQGLAARIEAWLEAQSLGRVHLVGHSLGAAVAACLAIAHPQRVQSLAAVCGAGFGGPLNRAYLEGFLAAERRKELKPVIELLFADSTRVTRQMVDDLIAYKRTDGVAQALRALIDGALTEASLTAVRQRLPELRKPILAIFGALDRVVPTPLTEDLTATIQMIMGAGRAGLTSMPALTHRRC
jgi:pyruvate dehydrogenase E2 component (dihydrolipoamide acetyltransferase)